MATSRSAEQVRAAKLAAMPKPLGEIHNALWREVAWLHLKWGEYRALFAVNQETIDLLNKTAPLFFHHLQGVLWEDVLLHLCRVTDPPKSAGRANLTLRGLPSLVSDAKLRAELEKQVALAQKKTEFARDWRNRRLAHKALPPAAGGDAKPLESASRQHVEEALAAIRDAMNCVELHYQGSTVGYDLPMELPGGTLALLFYLEKGLQAQAREDEGLLSRKSNPSD